MRLSAPLLSAMLIIGGVAIADHKGHAPPPFETTVEVTDPTSTDRVQIHPSGEVWTERRGARQALFRRLGATSNNYVEFRLPDAGEGDSLMVGQAGPDMFAVGDDNPACGDTRSFGGIGYGCTRWVEIRGPTAADGPGVTIRQGPLVMWGSNNLILFNNNRAGAQTLIRIIEGMNSTERAYVLSLLKGEQ